MDFKLLPKLINEAQLRMQGMIRWLIVNTSVIDIYEIVM